MASSGTFTGSRPLPDCPQLKLNWSILEQDIVNNRSKVRLILYLYSQYNISFSAPKSGVLDGTSFTYYGGMSGVGKTVTLYTKDVWVYHNSDGTKSVAFSGSLAINITWGGNWLGTITVSGTAVLDTIPRSSVLNSFSMGANLKTSTANSINLSITRYSTSFTNDIYLKHGSTTIASWTGQGTPTSLSLTSTQVNTLLTRLSNSTTATMTLEVYTKSGSTVIGSVSSRTATATVDGTVVPSISSFTHTISGTGRDKTIGKYVQGISSLTGSFTPTAGYGASISSSSITVRKQGGQDSQVINGSSGTTSSRLSLSGTYEVIAYTVDSRGRTASQTLTFTVYAYSNPKINTFTAVRNTTTDTTINITRNLSFTVLGAGDNTLTILTEARPSGGSFSQVQSTSTTTSPYTTGLNATNYSATSSFEFRLTITDSFGNTVSSTVAVSTAKVVLDIHQNSGVGIGKSHENGVLDISGEVYIINGSFPAVFRSNYIPADSDLNNYTTAGMYYCPANVTVATLLNCPTGGNAFSLLVETHAGTKQTITRYASSDITTWIRNKYGTTWGPWNQVFKSDGTPASHIHATSEISLGDHTSGTTPRVVGVIMGTGNPPTASTVPQGTIYLKYT